MMKANSAPNKIIGIQGTDRLARRLMVVEDGVPISAAVRSPGRGRVEELEPSSTLRAGVNRTVAWNGCAFGVSPKRP